MNARRQRGSEEQSRVANGREKRVGLNRTVCAKWIAVWCAGPSHEPRLSTCHHVHARSRSLARSPRSPLLPLTNRASLLSVLPLPRVSFSVLPSTSLTSRDLASTGKTKARAHRRKRLPLISRKSNITRIYYHDNEF